MRAIASSCAPGTADRSRVRWRLLGMVAVNTALWSLIIIVVRQCL